MLIVLQLFYNILECLSQFVCLCESKDLNAETQRTQRRVSVVEVYSNLLFVVALTSRAFRAFPLVRPGHPAGLFTARSPPATPEVLWGAGN